MSLSVSNQLGGPRSSVVKYLLSVEVEPDVSIGWQYLVEPESKLRGRQESRCKVDPGFRPDDISLAQCLQAD